MRVESLLALHGGVWVKELSTVFLDANHKLTGYPPLHNHHSRIFLSSKDVMTGAILFNHQDTTCYPGVGGGNLCQTTTFPEGYAVHLAEPLNTQLLANDVRPAGSPPMAWYFLNALRYSLAEPPTTRRLDIWEGFADIPLGYLLLPFTGFRVQHVGVLVTYGTPPISGRMLNVWVHLHETAGAVEAWHINATPSDLGLNATDYVYPKCSVLIATDFDSFKRPLLETMRASGLGFACIGQRAADHDAARGDSQPVWRCFEGGDQLTVGRTRTVVTFYDPGLGSPPTHGPTAPSQHNHYQGFVDSGSTQPFRKYFMPQRTFLNDAHPEIKEDPNNLVLNTCQGPLDAPKAKATLAEGKAHAVVVSAPLALAVVAAAYLVGAAAWAVTRRRELTHQARTALV